MDLFFTAIIESSKLCLDPILLLIILVGVIWGNIAGALPGIGPSLAVGVVLPFTFGMTSVNAIAFLVAINVACSYGNSIPAILVGVPGTTSAVLTATDGYALHKKGQSGLALGVQFYAAMTGAFLGIFFYFAMVVPLSGLIYVFLAPEMFALYFLGCTAVVSISSDNIVKGLLSAAFGLVVSEVGRDPVSSVLRFAFNADMRGGIPVMPVVMGILAVSEILRQMRQSFSWGGEASFSEKWKFPPLKSLWRVTPSVLMGTVIGQIVGAIPGIGGNTAAFVAYNQSKMMSKHPEEYGHGSIEGIAANEAAQNASQCGEMVPTFGLGIPGSSTMVLLFGALMMHGFMPGPMLIKENPQLFFASGAGLIASTLMLMAMGWFICGALLKVVTLDRQLILSGALALCMLGVYTLNRSTWDVFLLILFGVIGYFMLRYGYMPAGFAITLVLGDGLESNLRRGLLLTHKSLWEFLARPWTAVILAISFALIIYGTIGTVRVARRMAAVRRQALVEHLASVSASAKQ